MGSLGVVALFNSQTDGIALLGRLVESAGFSVVSARIADVRNGRCNIEAMMHRHDPAVVVYEIAPPYEESWSLFQRLRVGTEMRDRRFVITAANASRVEELAATDHRIYEVVETQADLAEVVKAIKEAARARVIRAEQPTSKVAAPPERRQHGDRRLGWTTNEVYAKLRQKREAVELERRQGSRRVADHDPNHSHAA